jgi:stage II sporulation protein P
LNRIRINKRSNLAYNLIVLSLITGIIILSYRLISNYQIFSRNNDLIYRPEEPVVVDEANKLGNGLDFFSEIWVRIKEINFTDPTYILSSHMPYLNVAHSQSGQINDFEKEENEFESTTTMAHQSEESSRHSQRPSSQEAEDYQESDGEERDISEEIQIQIKKINDNIPPVTLEGEGPQILIYHTHSREAYRQDPNNPYKAIAAFRSNDLNQTVVGVGEELARQLQARNIPVLHDRTDHEVYPWKAGLYPRSLETIEKRKKEHKSLKIFLDIHRNYNEKLKDPDKEVVIINGERVAKFFVLIGTAEGVSGGFSQKPKWRENYQFALKLTNKANEKYPGLANDIMVRTGRYNQHISNRAILIEVGNHMTTYEEAKRSAKYIAEALSDIIEK